MTFNDLKSSLNALDREQMLGSFGLRSRPSGLERFLQGMALVGTGVVVGVGVGLILAPRPGRELRKDLRSKLREASGPMLDAALEESPETRA